MQIGEIRRAFAVLGILFASFSEADSKDRLYVGAGTGKIIDNYDHTTRHTVTGFSVNNHPKSNTAIGTIFTGYGHTFANRSYLGVELGTDFPKRSTCFNRPSVTFPDITFRNCLSIENYLSGDVLPGFRIHRNVLVYGRLGMMYSHFSEVDENITFSTPRPAMNINQWGTRFGLGINVAITPHFSLGGDYIYTAYPTLNTTLSDFNSQFIQKTDAQYGGISLVYTA